MKKDYFLAIGLVLFSLTVFLGHFLFFRYTFPEVNIDEASFFSPAYSLAEKGQLSTDVHTSFLPGSSEYTYWMPPFYMLVLGGIFMVSAPSVFTAKLVSFLCIVISGIVLSFITENRKTKAWVVALLLICPFVILSSSFIRMEAMAFLIVSIAVVSVKNKVSALCLGVIAAIAVLTHPVLLACAAALAFVSMKRGIIPFVYFSIIFIILLAPYVFYLSLDFQLFKDQMALQLVRKAQRSFKDENVMYLVQSVPIALLSFILLWKTNVPKELKIFLFSGLTLSLIIILKSLEFNYHIYLIPYVIAITALYVDQHQERLYGKYLVPLGVYSFFALLLFSKIYLGEINTDKHYKELLQVLEKNKQWQGKTIYVSGLIDVSTFLVEHDQQVERSNAVANLKREGWAEKFNYVVLVKDNIHPNNPKEKGPWSAWENQFSHTSSNGHYTIFTYSKELNSTPQTAPSSMKTQQSFQGK